MFPQWIPGAAARDAMIRRPRGGGGSPSGNGDGFRGVLSFLGIALMAGATLALSLDARLGGFLACVLAVLVVVAAWWAAYRAHGPVGVAAGAGVAALASYSLYAINQGSGGGGWFWPLVVLLLVGLDQWALKSPKR